MSVTITTKDRKFIVCFPYSNEIVRAVKRVRGRTWNKATQAWNLPATPACAASLQGQLQRIGCEYTADRTFLSACKSWTIGSRVLQTDPSKLKIPDTKTPCFAHQRIGLALMMSRPGVYLAWDMGTGKGKTAVDTAEALRLTRVLIACPKSMIPEWAIQFERHSYGYRSLPLFKGSVPQRMNKAAQFLANGPGAVIINHESVWRDPFGEWVLDNSWDLIVVDEAHRLADGRSKVSKFFNKARDVAKRRLALSGTPVSNNPLSLWAQLRFVEPGVFGLNFLDFRASYAVMGGFEDRQVVAYKNLDDLHRRFYTVAHRITKEQALDLPPQIDERRIVSLSPRSKKIYKQIEDGFVAQVEAGGITISNALVELLRLQQITGGSITTDEGTLQVLGGEKQEELASYLSDLAAEEPVVVFCRFVYDLSVCRIASAKSKRAYFEISGARKQLEEWRAAAPGAVLGVQISSGGLGIDLSKAAYACYYSIGYSLAEYLQSRSRLHRHGQTRSVTFTHLVAEKTVDEKVYRALEKKQDVVRQILDEFKENA